MDYLEKLKKFENKWSYQEKIFNAYSNFCARINDGPPEKPNAFIVLVSAIVYPIIAVGPFAITFLALAFIGFGWLSIIPAGLLQWQYQKLRDPK